MAEQTRRDALGEGREQHFMDIDRMTNEGLAGGNVTTDNGRIEETTTDTMSEPESAFDEQPSEGGTNQ